MSFWECRINNEQKSLADTLLEKQPGELAAPESGLICDGPGGAEVGATEQRWSEAEGRHLVAAAAFAEGQVVLAEDAHLAFLKGAQQRRTVGPFLQSATIVQEQLTAKAGKGKGKRHHHMPVSCTGLFPHDDQQLP